MPKPLGLTDHEPLTQSVFRGLYDRGGDEDVPDEYFSDCLNNKFSINGVFSRDGLDVTSALTASNIVRYFQYKRLGETPRFIWLDTSGNLFDSLYYPTPIWTDASFLDFSGVNFLNRFYISPHNRVEGIAGKFVLVYEGAGTARLAAGVAPTSFTLVATESATSGKVETGIHLIAIAYQTTSGFVTAPGSSIAQVSSTGGKKIHVASIPVGGAFVASKVVLATKSIPLSLFTGNPLGYEFFFVPGATITNATVATDISFYDADLISSADFLFDNLATIPAGVAIFVYNNRLGVLGADGFDYTVAFSEKFEPETISSIDGYLTIDPSDGGSGLKNAFEYRKSIILCSSDRLYSTADNDNSPSTWATPIIIENSAGAEPFSVATVLDARGISTDRAFIASRGGLMCFEGYIKKPELSWNIEGIWSRINKKYFNLVQVVDDPIGHRILISVPLDTATAISHVLVADYSEAFTVYGTLNEKLYKWTIWTFPSAVVSMIGDKDLVTLKPVFHFALAAGNIYTMHEALINDFGNAFESSWKSSFKQSLEGWVNHFGGARFRVVGSAVLQIYVFGKDDTLPITPPAMTITTAPGMDYDRIFNFLAERASIKFRVSLINEYYAFYRLDVFSKPIYAKRPG